MKFYTETPGIGGRIKQRIEDFKVEEIPIEVKSGDEYTIFWMEKFNWDTHRALREIAKRLHVSSKRLGIAGTKDKRAVTKQRVSAWKIEPEQMEKIKIRDIKLYGFEKSDEKLNLGDLKGNKFTIIIRDIDLNRKEVENRIEKTKQELKNGIPNIFGPQRFGEVRIITHLVGKEMLKGNFEEAVKIYLAKVFEREPEDSKKAREFLKNNWNREGFKKSLELFPTRLRYERSILGYLVDHPNDFGGAIRRFPKKLRKMFLNAYQAYMWNQVVEKTSAEKLVLPGYNTKLDKSNESEKMVINILKKDGLTLDSFLMKHMPELKCSGSERRTVLKVADLDYEIDKDEINENKLKLILNFSLPPGSYATVILREIMKS